MDFHLTSSQFPSLRTFPPNSRNRLGRTPHSEPSIAGARVITCVSWSLQWCMQQKHARFFSLLFFLFFFFLLFTKKSQTHSLRDYRQTRSLSRPNPHLFGVTVAIPPFIRFSRRLWGREGGKVYLVYPRRNCIFQRVTMAYHARFPRRE